MSETFEGVVFYTDGSARPNPGNAGSSVHGYHYKSLGEKDRATTIKNWITTDKGYFLATDAAQMKAAKATPVKVIRYYDAVRSYPVFATNNFAEIMAIVTLFELYQELLGQVAKIQIYTDSEYTQKSITRDVLNWERNNWMTQAGTPVKNKAEFQRAYAHYIHYKDAGKIQIDWIRAHNEHIGNEMADYLSVVAGNRSRRIIANETDVVIEELVTDSYEKHHLLTKPVFHPLLDMMRIYFSSDPAWDMGRTIFQGGAEIGRRTSEAEFSVLQLTEEPKILHDVKTAQYESRKNKGGNACNAIMYTRIDRLSSPIVNNFLTRYGADALVPQGKYSMSLDFVDKKPVTFETTALELPLRTVEAFNIISEHLAGFQNNNLDVSSTPYQEGIVLELKDMEFCSMDVTDFFYKVEETEKKGVITRKHSLKKDFGVGIVETKLPVNVVIDDLSQSRDLLLFFGKDIPNRNTLRNIEDSHPRIYVITWKVSSCSFRYATVVKTDDAIGIWANYYASQVFLNSTPRK